MAAQDIHTYSFQIFVYPREFCERDSKTNLLLDNELHLVSWVLLLLLGKKNVAKYLLDPRNDFDEDRIDRVATAKQFMKKPDKLFSSVEAQPSTLLVQVLCDLCMP